VSGPDFPRLLFSAAGERSSIYVQFRDRRHRRAPRMGPGLPGRPDPKLRGRQQCWLFLLQQPRAAEAIFSHAAKAIEIEDIDARVSELERAAELNKTSGR
jgi:hypothetical protein